MLRRPTWRVERGARESAELTKRSMGEALEREDEEAESWKPRGERLGRAKMREEWYGPLDGGLRGGLLK